MGLLFTEERGDLGEIFNWIILGEKEDSNLQPRKVKALEKLFRN